MKINKQWLFCLFSPAKDEGTVDGLPTGNEEVKEPEPEEEEVVGIDDHIDTLLGEPEPEPEPDPTPAVEPEPEPEKKVEPEPEPEKKVEPDVEPEKKGEPEVKVEPEVEKKVEPEVTVEPTAEEQKVAQEEEVKKFMDGLETQYAVSEADADLLVSAPEKVLPKLAANIHAKIMSQVVQAMPQMMEAMVAKVIQAQPQIVTGAMSRQTEAQKANDNFDKAFPELVGKDAELKTAATAVMANFPDLSLEEKMQKTGEVAYAMLGLVRKSSAEDEPPAVAPFTPVSTSNSSGKVPPGKKDGVWEEFI